MNTNIRDYPLFYWIIALSFDVVFTVAPVLISFYSFYRERDKFFKDPDFRNEAFEKHEKEKLKKKTEKEEEKQKKIIPAKSKSLPAIKPNINEKISIDSNAVNTNNIENNNNLQKVKNEVSFSHKNNLEEKKYTYQDYLKKGLAQAQINKNNVINNTNINNNNNNNIITEHTPNKSEIVHIDSKNQLNTNNPIYTNVKFYSESNLVDNIINNNNNYIQEDLDILDKDFGEDVKNIENIEKEMLRKHRRSIRFEFFLTIAILIIDTYSNIDTFINLKPRFLDTQFILYNNSYLINEKNLIYNKTLVIKEYLKVFPIENNNFNINNRNLESFKNLTRNNKNNNNTKYLRFLNSTKTSIKPKYNPNKNSTSKSKQQKKSFNEKSRQMQSSEQEDQQQQQLKDLNTLIQAQNKNNIKFIYTNIEQHTNISLAPNFNISNCKRNSKSDLEKINYIYQFSALRYSLLIINTILDVFIMLLTTIGFVYKAEINKLYKTKFMLVLLFLLDKCWSMCAVAYSYFDLTTNECLNAIENFNEFFYAYLIYVFLFFSLIFLIFIYSFFCRQMLYYILMILVSGLTLFIPVLFCLEKQQKCMERIYLDQELRLKDDLEDMRNFKFKRQKQNCQLWFAYLVFLFIALTGISALVNFGILKYIWIVNSWRTLAPAVGSITTFVTQFFQRCF